MKLIFKICRKAEWAAARQKGLYRGSEVDQRDGFIHFSAAHQVKETAARHFGGQQDLVVVAVETAALGPSLRWEPSRGGDLFPHVYGPLATDSAHWVKPLPLVDGVHAFPDL